MLLYNSPVSGNCYKVRLLLAHLGIPYERRDLDVVDRSDRPDVLGGLNPDLRVPTLVLDDGGVGLLPGDGVGSRQHDLLPGIAPRP